MEDAVPEASSDIVVNEGEDADAEGDVEVNGDDDEVLPNDGKPYALRQRAKVNYAIPPPLDEIPLAPPKPASGRHGGGRSNWNRSSSKKGPGWSANGAELSRFLGLPGEDSVCGVRSVLFPVVLRSSRIQMHRQEFREKGLEMPHLQAVSMAFYQGIWPPQLELQQTLERSATLVSFGDTRRKVMLTSLQHWQMPTHLV